MTKFQKIESEQFGQKKAPDNARAMKQKTTYSLRPHNPSVDG